MPPPFIKHSGEKMSHYMIKKGKACLVNIALYQSYKELSDKGLMLAVHNPASGSRNFLNNMLFLMDENEVSEIKAKFPCIIVQDIDIALAALCAHDKTIKAKEVTVPVSAMLYDIDSFQFAKLSDIKMEGKYARRENLPHIKICGSIYVALNADFKEKRKERYVAVTAAGA
jgi:hypothetical protein